MSEKERIMIRYKGETTTVIWFVDLFDHMARLDIPNVTTCQLRYQLNCFIPKSVSGRVEFKEGPRNTKLNDVMYLSTKKIDKLMKGEPVFKGQSPGKEVTQKSLIESLLRSFRITNKPKGGMMMELKTEEIVAAIELLVEQNKGQFTIPQLTQFFLPDLNTGVGETAEHSRNYRVVNALHSRGDLVRHEPLPGTYSPIYSIAPGGIKREGLDMVCPTPAEKSILRAKSRSVSISQSPSVVMPHETHGRVIPRMDEIFEALNEEFKNSPEGVTVQAVSARFPNSSVEDVRLRLNVMESEGLVKSTKIGIARLYQPILAERSLPMPSTKAIRKEVKRALAFPCEVCDGPLIGVRAQNSIYTVPCNNCGAIYMVEKGEAYRLGPGIKVLVWIPDPGSG